MPHKRIGYRWLSDLRAIAGDALLAGVVVAVSFAGIAPERAPVVAGVLAVLGTAVLCWAGMIAVIGLLRPTTGV